ncbi:hypothetical protein BN137_2665 [Cronobacter condimenti 1330]|uniref:Uncharacterized protein n=1 Tax=Cronobacter condimenti 1330 TaxID=1073999 RepID=K8ABX7_9ENTR|nr:hypothetical protein BN137_2665 [Cronobacter condimenti 1330]
MHQSAGIGNSLFQLSGQYFTRKIKFAVGKIDNGYLIFLK